MRTAYLIFMIDESSVALISVFGRREFCSRREFCPNVDESSVFLGRREFMDPKSPPIFGSKCHIKSKVIFGH